jgi:endo-1,4-beta-mannosidase
MVQASVYRMRISYAFKSGLNYLSSSNRFYQSDAVTEADFAFFKAQGITDLSIRIFWKSVVEDSNVIGNYKRLLAVADEYGLNVQLDFWTQFPDEDDEDWSKPAFLTSTYDIIRVPEAKQMWLDFVASTMLELKPFGCIRSWTMMNEPFDNRASDIPLFYQCWSEQYRLMKSIDDRPVSIRFALGASPWSGEFSKYLAFYVCDYIAITVYLDPSDPGSSRWGSTWRMFDKCVSDCKRANKPLIISEFGTDTGSDEDKRVWYEKSLDLFINKGIQKAYGWSWQTTNPANEPFNIYPGTPAFYELSDAAGRRVYNSWFSWF